MKRKETYAEQYCDRLQEAIRKGDKQAALDLISPDDKSVMPDWDDLPDLIADRWMDLDDQAQEKFIYGWMKLQDYHNRGYEFVKQRNFTNALRICWKNEIEMTRNQKSEMGNQKFDIEHQYQLFLKRMALKEEDMHPEQKKQLRQTFYGACGQMLILLRDDIGALTENEAIEVMQKMINQIGNYFLFPS